MFARLALLFVVVPLVELALLVQLGRWVGLWPTLALVLGTGFTGAALARAQGLRTLSEFQRETAAGRLPSGPLMDGLAVLIGGAFLLTPGLLTDVAGFSLLLPATRRWIRKAVTARLRRMQEKGTLRVAVMTPFGPAFGPGFGSGSGPGFGPGPHAGFGFGAPSSEGESDDDAGAAAGLDPRNEIDPRRR